nr:uncharacterized protein LOC125183543 [Anser cygnoides]
MPTCSRRTSQKAPAAGRLLPAGGSAHHLGARGRWLQRSRGAFPPRRHMHTLLLLLTPGQHLPGIVWFMLALRASNLKIKGLHKQKDSLFSLENTQHPTGLSSRQQERRVKLVTAAVGVWSASPSCALPPGTQGWARQRATDPDSSASALPAGAAAASTAPHRRKKWDWWRQSLDSQHFHWQFLDRLDGSCTTFQAIKRNRKHPFKIKIWRLR